MPPKMKSTRCAKRSAIRKGLFTRMPVHPYILMFHLDCIIISGSMSTRWRLTRYQPESEARNWCCREEQTDLIDILTAEMDMLMDDIVQGKSGGTTVLCAGPPGVGKTLTAEVYSEIIQRPLYRVHSGQLGLNVSTMETALKDILDSRPALGRCHADRRSGRLYQAARRQYRHERRRRRFLAGAGIFQRLAFFDDQSRRRHR